MWFRPSLQDWVVLLFLVAVVFVALQCFRHSNRRASCDDPCPRCLTIEELCPDIKYADMGVP